MANINNCKVKNFVNAYSNKKVFYDQSFQRREVWNSDNISTYVRSLTFGIANLTSVVVSNVRQCLEYSKSVLDQPSISYYQNILDKGYEYISLDGQNRSKSVLRFINNEVTITTDIRDMDGVREKVTNKFFKDLTQRQKDMINDAEIMVVTSPPVLLSELSSIFRSLNKGEPLNPQEKRNSIRSPITEAIRNLSKTYNPAIKKVIKKPLIKRMGDDEIVAKILMVLMQNKPTKNGLSEWGLSTGEINDFYKMGIGFSNLTDPSSPYNMRSYEKCLEILDMWSSVVLSFCYSKNTMPLQLHWAIIYACKWACENDFYISDPNTFLAELKKIEDDLITTSEENYAKERRTKIANKQDPDSVSKINYYFGTTGLPHQTSPRKRRQEILISEIKKNLNTLTLRKNSDQNLNIAAK